MPNCYMDSILILSVSRELMKLPGVRKAVAVMATDMNKTVVDEFGGTTPAVAAAGANDLIISLDCEDEGVMSAAEDKVRELASGKASAQSAAAELEYRSLAAAKKALPEANICTISLPGEYAGAEARTALANDMNLFIFSDMDEDEELELKRIAHEKGLFVMGPGAGTAVVNGLSIGLMSKIRRGRIGIVAASGSGLQEVAVLVHQLGEGISQAIGVGGHDLSQKVGGIMFLQAMDYFASDPDTEVLVLVSKPPHPDTARKIYAVMRMSEANVEALLAGEDVNGGEGVKDPACLAMTTESLTREFPLYTPSLLNLVKTSETHVKGLTPED